MTTRREMLAQAPWRFDILSLLREFERSAPDKPRIGRSAVMAQDIVRLGQDPFIAFPASNVTEARFPPDRTPEVRVRFLGLFGPQGPLPLTTTIEALQWMRDRNDDSFVHFADIFTNRFLQLYFRAWAEARPVVQFDRPDDDRFRMWLGAHIGVGSPALSERDAIPDLARLEYAGVLGSRIRSAARLLHVMRRMLNLDVELEERVGTWLEFEPGDLSRLGSPRASLGQTSYLGARVYSINDKARLTIRTRSLREYESFLPGTGRCRELTDFLYFYLGDMTEIDVALAMPASALPETRLGKTGRLGWTSWSAPDRGGDPDRPVVCATFAASSLRQRDMAANAGVAGPATEPPPDTGPAASPDTAPADAAPAKSPDQPAQPPPERTRLPTG